MRESRMFLRRTPRTVECGTNSRLSAVGTYLSRIASSPNLFRKCLMMGTPSRLWDKRVNEGGSEKGLTASMTSSIYTARMNLSRDFSSKETASDEAQYEALKRSVLNLGFIRWGSLVKRFMPCGKPGCCCQRKPPRLHGPYYQWTRKVKGKTATVRLTSQEARIFQEWIANGRQFDRVISQMEKISSRITNRLLKQVRIS